MTQAINLTAPFKLMDFGQWNLPVNPIWCKGSFEERRTVKKQERLLFASASLIVSAYV